jgi:serine phosphatase RsbU (regulator of sigma subunit)
MDIFGAADSLESTLTMRLFFEVRHTLGLSPKMSPRLKVYIFDDDSVARLQRPDLTMDDWLNALEAIDRQGAQTILIDKVFSIVFDPFNHKADWLPRLKALKTPIYVGGFALPKPQQWRSPLNLDRPLYDLASVRKDNSPLPSARDYQGWFVYGPHPELAPIFAGSGLLHYDEMGRVEAFFAFGDRYYVPALPLLAAQDRSFSEGVFAVDGRPVGLDRNGRIPVNFIRPSEIYASSYRLGSMLAVAQVDLRAKEVSPGDTVVILPAMYTGSTDFHKSPVGTIPGGLVQVSLVNSVLGVPWLGALQQSWLLVLALGVAGILLGAYVRLVIYAAVLIAGTIFFVAFGLCCFLVLDFILPVIMPLFSLWGCSLISFAHKTRIREVLAHRDRSELREVSEKARVFRPSKPPGWAGIDIADFHLPYTEGGGDWYAFASSASGHLRHFVMVDVAGHGVQATLTVSVAKTVFSMLERQSPKSLEHESFIQTFIEDFNGILYKNSGGAQLVTMVGFTYDMNSAHIHCIVCGHPPPILLTPSAHHDKSISYLSTQSNPIGILESLHVQMVSQLLQPGSEIICYTDGMTRSRSHRQLKKFFNTNNLPYADKPKALNDYLWQIETEKTQRKSNDDISVVWFKFK